MSINESEIFEYNDLFINGNNLKSSIAIINDKFIYLYLENFKTPPSDEEIKSLSVEDINIESLEEKIENILDDSKDKILKNKKIFKIKKEKYESNSLCLRNEAEVVQQYISNISFPSYYELKQEMFSNCELNSYKNYGKKVIGKENNYVFNLRDDYLNDMTKIDRDFFTEYYKIEPKRIELKDSEKAISNISSIRNIELIYDFAIYHPSKNVKTQQVSIKGSCSFHELKDKIYCVLDEIYTNESQMSFFFIENSFYNDTRYDDSKYLSNKIIENKIRKLNINDLELRSKKSDSMNNFDSKFEYDKDLYYYKQENFNHLNSEIYNEFTMSEYCISDVTIRIGYPYLFRHIDHCDHMIMLTDIRAKDNYDIFLKDSNSIITYQKKIKRRICDSCLLYFAKFISINDTVDNTSKILFFCESCLKGIHKKDFTQNNSNSLKLIPYFHD